uniref:Ras-related protein Rab-39A n=1 Tax=Camelus bactrianus TaxID=9837 RepID=A0A9W3G544_CAMBA|nr:ras-related protein Rab-39A [Camelus bactrianus]
MGLPEPGGSHGHGRGAAQQEPQPEAEETTTAKPQPGRDEGRAIFKLYYGAALFEGGRKEQFVLLQPFFFFYLFFRSITRSYYRNSVGGFLVFDITNRRSFEHVKDWLEEAKMHVQPFRIVFLLVGHKCDLASQRQVTREEAERLSADCGMKYIETSAKDATNVEESFTILTRDIYELIKRGEICIQDGWEGVKSGFVPNTVHSSEEAVKPRKTNWVSFQEKYQH